MKEVTFCPCGLVEGHKNRCLSLRFDDLKARIPKYSGHSKSYEGFQNVKKSDDLITIAHKRAEMGVE